MSRSGTVPQREEMRLLLVEDSEADVHLIRRALRNARIRIHLDVSGDGYDALDFLFRRGAHSDAPRPDLVLLDLNLPGRDGHAILREVKADPDLCEIPVVIYSSSGAQQDIRNCYRQKANCYVRKPQDLDEFLNVVRSIESFWLETADLPH
jgi:two-component system, chemotaxis family, response regulator Rcp1